MAALRAQFQAFIDAHLSPAARSGMLADAARKMRADLLSSGRALAPSVTFVDGRQNDNENAVRGTGGGTVTYRFSSIAAAAQWALDFLRARSPVRHGAFRDSFYVGVNGRFIPAASFRPESVPYDAEVVIGNTEPYSRKIDVQIDGSRTLHFSVPAGMFDDCARAVARAFGRVVTAKRIYTLNFPGQYRLHRGPNRGSAVNSPAVIINPVL